MLIPMFGELCVILHYQEQFSLSPLPGMPPGPGILYAPETFIYG